jgi:hypothetical protein
MPTALAMQRCGWAAVLPKKGSWQNRQAGHCGFQGYISYELKVGIFYLRGMTAVWHSRCWAFVLYSLS